jgi:Xaa-Pro aminopeptidase
MEPVCDGVRFSPPIAGRQLAGLVRQTGAKRIGMVLPNYMTAELDQALLDQMPDAERVDVSIPIAVARAVKSQEELAAIQESRSVQVKIYDALGQIIRPGRCMRDIEQEVHYLVRQQGGGNVVHAHLICDGPQNQPSAMHKYDDRIVQRGDRFFALMEANGAGGQHICFGRCLTLGEPTPELVKAYDAATKLHQYAVSLMKPGATLGRIAVQTRKYANTLGYEMREHLGWNWMHSLGGYYYEQYALEDYTEDVPIQAGILLHCHPVIYRPFPEIDPFVREEDFVLGAYQVTEQGAKDLIGVPFGIRVLD